MLELRLDEASGIYSAPLQMKANNGIFIVDDFGRQLMSPRDLLNRWIVPLARRVPAESDSAEFLRRLCLREGRTELRACYPSDICNILESISQYEGRLISMTKPDLERTTALYFAKT